MPRVAAYDVVTDNPITLSDASGQQHTADINLALAPELVISGQSVLTFMLDPGPSGVTFKMSVITSPLDTNEVVVSVVPATNVGPMSGHVRQEVIAGGALSPTKSRLRIAVTFGSATFADIVLWHQSDV